MYTAAVAVLGLLSLVLYQAYKKFRAAPYQPGAVAAQVLAHPEEFDDESLYQLTNSGKNTDNNNKWYLPPNKDEIFYFPPKLAARHKPPVLAVHGGPAIAPAEPWKLGDIIPNLYLYHARGCGYSSRPLDEFPTPGKMWPGMKLLEQQLGIGMQVSDVERIRRRLLLMNNDEVDQQKIDIVGHSFGGFIATLYAAEFPQHVRSLTLLVPAAVLVLPTTKGDEDEELFAMVEAKLKERGNAQHVQDFQAFLKEYLDFGSLSSQTEESLALRQAGFAKHYCRAAKGVDQPADKPEVDPKMIGGMACYATFLSMGMEHNYIPVLKDRLKNSRFPVSIVHGTKDFVPESTSLKYVDLFPPGQAEFYTVEGDHDLFDVEDVGKVVERTISRASL